ncbi:MAG: DUF4145 domain-containing protein [Candidatus Hydrogenedentes bacterium]|nr:DUF4145 domain-containing protein [Candidatus Hydrogenedentota bacterium]
MLGNLFGRRKGSVGKTGEKLPERHEGLPDSTLPYGLCPRCQKQSSFDVGQPQPVTFDPDVFLAERDGSRTRVHVDQVCVLYCRSCRQGVAVVEEQRTEERSWREPGAGKGGGVITWRGIHWWPAGDAHVSADVPAQIAAVFQEAVRGLHADCPRASAVIARRTLEAIAVDKGETAGTLADRLANLASKGILLPTLADWSKQVRLVGNVGAHFDPIDSVSKKDAEVLVSFVRQLLRYLYELPAELARQQNP